jgi:hypothetical protein
MTPFLTVKEASHLTGKSPSSIRRVIYPIIRNDTHPDRGHIEPGVEDALRMRMKGDTFAWRLSEDLLRRAVPLDTASAKPSASLPRGEADTGLLAMLRAELEIKNRQIGQQSDLIARQMELISGLSERLREGNVLMGSLQQRLALPESRAVHTAVSVKPESKPKRPSSHAAEKGSTISSKATKAKRTWLSRIFSPK